MFLFFPCSLLMIWWKWIAWRHISERDLTWRHISERDLTWRHISERDLTWRHISERDAHIIHLRMTSRVVTFSRTSYIWGWHRLLFVLGLVTRPTMISMSRMGCWHHSPEADVTLPRTTVHFLGWCHNSEDNVTFLRITSHLYVLRPISVDYVTLHHIFKDDGTFPSLMS